MPAFESRRVRTHPRTVTSLSTATRPWSTSATGTTLIIFSLLIVGKINTCPPVNGDTYVTWHLQSDKQNSQMQRKISELKVKRSRLAPDDINWLFNMRKVERFAQRPNKRFIVADRFARAVRKFRHRFTVTLYQLNDNIQRFYLGISQVRRVPIPKLNCTREEKWRYSSTALRKSRLSEKTSVLLCGSIPSFS